MGLVACGVIIEKKAEHHVRIINRHRNSTEIIFVYAIFSSQTNTDQSTSASITEEKAAAV